MFFNPNFYENSVIQGVPFLQWRVSDNQEIRETQVAPLKKSILEGTVSGPLAEFQLLQIFSFERKEINGPIEVVYRFPLPGDSAVTGVIVSFGDEIIETQLLPRSTAEEQYQDARQTRRQAAILTRESPDVFTLKIHGINPGIQLQVRTKFIQVSVSEESGFSFRIPLTTSPRFVRSDETNSRHAEGNPLVVVHDPMHRFSVRLSAAGGLLQSPTHPLNLIDGEYTLSEGEIVPDRDFQIFFIPQKNDESFSAQIFTSPGNESSILALITPPRTAKRIPLDVLVLVDHSGSMNGPKRYAADNAVKKFVSHLQPEDVFNLACFDHTQKWHTQNPVPASVHEVVSALSLLDEKMGGATNLGVIIEQSLMQDRVPSNTSRHVLLISDCEVSDMGRIYQVVRQEQDRKDGRRCSVLCIDSSPNSTLARRIAEISGGVVRFLTSDPNEHDIENALSDILSSFENIVAEGVTLTVNRSSLISNGKRVSSDSSSSTIMVPPVSEGRASWVIGEAGQGEGPLVCAITLPDGTSVPINEFPSPGVSKIMGAWVIQQLEYLMHSDSSDDEVYCALEDLGIKGHVKESHLTEGIYAENRIAKLRKSLSSVIQQISLETGVISSETAFYAERKAQGEKTQVEVIVPSANPHGWDYPKSHSSGGNLGNSNSPRSPQCSGNSAPSWLGSRPSLNFASGPGPSFGSNLYFDSGVQYARPPKRVLCQLSPKADDENHQRTAVPKVTTVEVFSGVPSDEKEVVLYDSLKNTTVSVDYYEMMVTKVIIDTSVRDGDEPVPESIVIAILHEGGSTLVRKIPLNQFTYGNNREWIDTPKGLKIPVIIKILNPGEVKITQNIIISFKLTHRSDLGWC
ncbi:MAG TPA: VIT and VWA domain-containing protein [Methanospirillum sp.]|nr:VIT and VWA domain-containing protein [Methanospirillum sp.]